MQLIKAERSTLKSPVTYSFNESGELVISATDGNNDDASCPALVVPTNSPFLLFWSPDSNNWLQVPISIEPGYQFVEIVQAVV